MKCQTASIASLYLATTLAHAAGTTSLPISNFTSQGLQEWETQEFSGKTVYTLIKEHDQTVLKAEAHASASALIKKVSVDLNLFPYLNWKWKVSPPLKMLPEKDKAGDDYAARLYVIFSTGPFFWQKRALTYAWSSSSPKDSDWPNAFTDKTHMVASNNHLSPHGVWLDHKRNIKQDIQHYFGLDITQITAVALMTDSDNSAGQATAYYGNIFFSSQ